MDSVGVYLLVYILYSTCLVVGTLKRKQWHKAKIGKPVKDVIVVASYTLTFWFKVLNSTKYSHKVGLTLKMPLKRISIIHEKFNKFFPFIKGFLKLARQVMTRLFTFNCSCFMVNFVVD